ncbi:uncharacterized protein LY89DRAFT_35984 [Mollisia scopiformis]|uniref:Ribosomal RNA-processing protein 7 n=1 Tax=Mollisia scopiformis TaxID=149040 RepID=A0A194XD18_MOLSC|nr:uncharacterized protein LY89DRAFT_35984 [Mollisia scopiformis]KUJ18046.1 hypothetical protein LY89DRAFT_35984 [Mollisia scopiformis]
MSPSQISDYALLPITIPPIPSYPHQTTHTLYLRPHAPKIPTPNDARSLFLVNLPIDSTTASLRSLFTSLVGAGKFEDCSFEHERVRKPLPAPANGSKKRKRADDDTEEEIELPRTWDRDLRRSGSSAVVLLVDEKSVELVLKTVRKLHKKGRGGWPVWESEGSTGSQRYRLHHTLSFPDPKILQANIDTFMSAFNDREESRKREERKGRQVPDEDGFVTVMRGGRTGPARAEEVERKRAEMEERERKKRGEMGDFYRFQMRERRKEVQGEMVRRFEEDRRRVEGMRRERGRFRPES